MPQKGIKSEDQTWINEGDAVENVHRLTIAQHPKSSFDRICSGSRPPHTVEHDLDILATFVEVAKPGSEVRITQVVKNDTSKDQSPLGLASTLVKNVKLAGLINIKDPITIDISPDTKKDIKMKFHLSTNSEFEVIEIVCQAPNFESGSSQLLSFAKKDRRKKASR